MVLALTSGRRHSTLNKRTPLNKPIVFLFFFLLSSIVVRQLCFLHEVRAMVFHETVLSNSFLFYRHECLVENTPLVKRIRNHIRDSSGIVSTCSLVKIYRWFHIETSLGLPRTSSRICKPRRQFLTGIVNLKFANRTQSNSIRLDWVRLRECDYVVSVTRTTRVKLK